MMKQFSISSGEPDIAASAVPGVASAMPAMLRWFLVLTKASGEQTAKLHLERQGFHVYYPRLIRSVLYRGHWVDRIVSLFPRYVFVRLDAARQSLAPVRSTLGVANLVRFGSEPKVVPDRVVSGLMDRADPESGLHRLGGGSRALLPGASVSVIAGAFEGLEGIFEREAGQERVVVLLKLLGQDASVRIDSRYVVPSIA